MKDGIFPIQLKGLQVNLCSGRNFGQMNLLAGQFVKILVNLNRGGVMEGDLDDGCSMKQSQAAVPKSYI